MADWPCPDSEGWERVAALVEAAEGMSERSSHGDGNVGCPGFDEHGPHDDIIHVAPYHCAPESASCPMCAALGPRPMDLGSEYGRLMAERDRLIGGGVDPAELDVPEPPRGPRP